MFGRVINSKENHVIIENPSHNVILALQGVHVVFEESERLIIGQIVSLDSDKYEITLIVEISNGRFYNGIYKQPSISNPPRLVNSKELITFIGNQNYKDNNTLLIGTSTIYNQYNITASLNDFFSNHFAIVGNSGYGKSCGVARLLQNAFYYHETPPKNAHIVLFDVYGEYNNAFSKIEGIPGLKYKNYKNESSNVDSVIKIPTYFLDADDLAILLDVENPHLVPVLEKALYYVRVFKSVDESSIKYKNHIIATTLIDILSLGRNAAQMRDQMISILERYNTPDINENSKIVEPGYTRTLKQCLNVDTQGKINAISLVIEFLNQYKNISLEEFQGGASDIYNLQDLYNALEFALLSEGIYNNEGIYEKASTLKVRLGHIINSPKRKFFEYDQVISKEEYIQNLFKNEFGEPLQIINFNLDTLDDRFAKVLTKIYSKLFFNYTTNLQDRGSYPIHIILEEAHRYVNSDTDIHVLGYNIFDRITKEGRKYGVILGLITQRPSELSKTALSQCSNFLIFRLFHPEDYDMIVSMTSSVPTEELLKLKTLRRGIALGFGSAFATPFLVQLDMPDPPPMSNNVNITKTWF
ncbi:MAG: ATP-binding protein [Bacilli bacterium]|nr:ATP-binding protein [Bacilli bacterium]